jgi:hypothetical protein
MISEHISQTFICNIREIKYDITHDGDMSIFTAENALHRALWRLHPAGSGAGCSKSVTVI